MKFTFFTILLLLVSIIVKGQSAVLLKGKVEHIDGHALFLSYKQDGQFFRDTIATNKGLFEKKLMINGPVALELRPYKFAKNAIRDTLRKFYYQSPGLTIFVVPGDRVTINGDALKLWEADVGGEKYETNYQSLHAVETTLLTQQEQLARQQYHFLVNADTIAAKAAKLAFLENRNTLNKLQKQFFSENTDNIYAIFLFSNGLLSLQPKQIENIYARYPDSLKSSAIGKNIHQFIQRNKKVGQGAKMIDFKGTTLDGQAFNTKMLSGQYVLLDFWGSWCKPCRKSHPHLKDLYSKYHPKGLEIVGISSEIAHSITTAKNSWMRAIQADDLPWIQLLNNALKEKMDVVKAYHVKSFPTKILIDPKGVIIWKGIGSEATGLDKTLKSLFD